MDQLRGIDVGGVLIGLIIVGIGFYYFLTNTLGLPIPQLDWDQVWPLFIIALGVSIVSANWMRHKDGGSGS